MTGFRFCSAWRHFFPGISHNSTLLRQFHKSPRLNQKDTTRNKKIRSTLYYVSAAGVLTVGLSYAAVPLYRMFCQAYSYGGTTSVGHDTSKIETMSSVKHRPITIRFNADTASSMRWNFKPQQTEITVCVLCGWIESFNTLKCLR